MYFKQFLDEHCGCASYLIASRQTHEAAIVDPSIAIEQYEEIMRERDFRLRYVIDTHVHADHVSGARELAERTGALLCLHGSAGVEFPFTPLRDGQRLEIGNDSFEVLHTPGHTPESICLVAVDHTRGDAPWLILTG
ncbi:MAG: MBL fold metallo-hydrolase, partial [Chloroflexota bacterium]